MNQPRMYRGRKIVCRMKTEMKRKHRDKLIARDGLWCNICHRAIHSYEDVTIDHIIPLAKGGTNHFRNLQLAHKRCNERKGMRRMAKNTPFRDAFEDLGLIRPMKAPRYLPVYVWSLFQARINLDSMELEIPVGQWGMLKRSAFYVVTQFGYFKQWFLHEPYDFNVAISPAEYEKLSQFDKIRFENQISQKIMDDMRNQ